MMIRRIASFAAAAFISIAALAISIASTASAQTHTTFHNGWQISIDESPSPEFIAEAHTILLKSYEPPAPTPSLPWCCYVGNYGGVTEPGDTDDSEIPFIRITDDISENGVAGPIVLVHCEDQGCQFVWGFGGEFESYQPVIAAVVALIDRSPAEPWLFPSPIDREAHPVFVGKFGIEHPLPQVWSLTVLATPEPTTQSLWIVAMSVLGFGRRRHKLRPVLGAL